MDKITNTLSLAELIWMLSWLCTQSMVFLLKIVAGISAYIHPEILLNDRL